MIKHDFDWSIAPYPWSAVGPRFRREVELIVGVKPEHRPVSFRPSMACQEGGQRSNDKRHAAKEAAQQLRTARDDHRDRLRAAERAAGM